MPAPSNQNKELGKVFLEPPQGIFIENPRKCDSIKSATKESQRGRGERERRRQTLTELGGRGTNREDCREKTRKRREKEGEIRPNRMRHKTTCFMPSPQVSLPSKLRVWADKGVRGVCRSSP